MDGAGGPRKCRRLRGGMKKDDTERSGRKVSPTRKASRCRTPRTSYLSDLVVYLQVSIFRRNKFNLNTVDSSNVCRRGLLANVCSQTLPSAC